MYSGLWTDVKVYFESICKVQDVLWSRCRFQGVPFVCVQSLICTFCLCSDFKVYFGLGTKFKMYFGLGADFKMCFRLFVQFKVYISLCTDFKVYIGLCADFKMYYGLCVEFKMYFCMCAEFKVYFVGTSSATATLDYDVIKTHLITVKCTDTATTTTGTAVLEVDILPNQQPVITDYPAGRCALQALWILSLLVTPQVGVLCRRYGYCPYWLLRR